MFLPSNARQDFLAKGTLPKAMIIYNQIKGTQHGAANCKEHRNRLAWTSYRRVTSNCLDKNDHGWTMVWQYRRQGKTRFYWQGALERINIIKYYHQPETRGTSEDTDNKRQGIKKPNAASMASLDRSIDHWAGFQHFPVLLWAWAKHERNQRKLWFFDAWCMLIKLWSESLIWNCSIWKYEWNTLKFIVGVAGKPAQAHETNMKIVGRQDMTRTSQVSPIAADHANQG